MFLFTEKDETADGSRAHVHTSQSATALSKPTSQSCYELSGYRESWAFRPIGADQTRLTCARARARIETNGSKIELERVIYLFSGAKLAVLAVFAVFAVFAIFAVFASYFKSLKKLFFENVEKVSESRVDKEKKIKNNWGSPSSEKKFEFTASKKWKWKLWIFRENSKNQQIDKKTI